MNAPTDFIEQAALSRSATELFAQFADRAVRVTSPDNFVVLVKIYLQPILPHGMMLAGLGHARCNRLTVYQAISTNYPRTYLESLIHRQSASTGPVLQRWLKTREPQVLNLDEPDFPLPDRWLASARKHNLKNIASHGVRDVNGFGASYFTFSQIPAEHIENATQQLKLVVPHLHTALTQTCRPAVGNPILSFDKLSDLTDREFEILQSLAEGKSNKEIGQALNRSEFTVKTHLQRVFRKLKVNSRTEAVFKATSIMRGS